MNRRRCFIFVSIKSTLKFKFGLTHRKLRKLLAKEEEEEVQEDIQRDSKVVK